MTVYSLQHLCLAVPDPALGARFYEDFGLEAEDRGDRMALRCAGRDQDQIVLVEGARRQLHHICLGTDEAGLEALKSARADIRRAIRWSSRAASAMCSASPPISTAKWISTPACSACV